MEHAAANSPHASQPQARLAFPASCACATQARVLAAGGPAGLCGRPRPQRGCSGALALQPGAASHSDQASAAAQSSAALAGGGAACRGTLAAALQPCERVFEAVKPQACSAHRSAPQSTLGSTGIRAVMRCGYAADMSMTWANN